MKKKVIIIIVVGLLLVLGIIGGTYIYNNYIKEEIVELEFEVDVYSNQTLFNFKNSFECNLKDDTKINTDKVEKVEIITHCKNDKKNKFKYITSFNVVDKVEPKIILKNSYTVTKGYNKNLTDVIISVDNYDDNPKREIVGEYDFNKVGSYNLTYKITDSSNNVATQDFTLYVVEPKKSNNNSSNNDSFIAFSDVLKDKKNDSTMIGIDVSKWQEKIDFEKVKNAGAEFVVIRIGHQDGMNGEYIIDPYFEENIKNAKKSGLKIGVYFYTYANSNEEALKQAKWIIKTLDGEKLDLPIVYDWESWSSFNSYNLGLHNFNEVAKTFLEEIENNGYDAMLYSSKNYLENIWYDMDYKVWLAHYTNNTNYLGKYYMWQMCSDGKIDGIKGYVDIDILYK